MLKLNILDQSPITLHQSPEGAIHETIRLAQETERMGYHRFWVSEHHNSRRLAGSTPEVLLGALTLATSRIRIGSGGVLLPYYSPLKVAENFRLLDALAPGRIDLGIGRAPGGDFRSMLALGNGDKRQLDDFPDKVRMLMAWLHDAVDEAHQFAPVHAMPSGDRVPEIWLLGSSDTSAKIAAELGTAFSFAQFINSEGGAEVVQMYRDRFQPSMHLQAPRAQVAIFVVCGATDEAVERLVRLMDVRFLWFEQGRIDETPSIEEALQVQFADWEWQRVLLNRPRMVFGKPKEVQQQLVAMAHGYDVDELTLVTITDSFETRLESYALVAEAFGLAGE